MRLEQVCCTPQQNANNNGKPHRHGYSEMDNGTKICHILQGIKSTELESVVSMPKQKSTSKMSM